MPSLNLKFISQATELGSRCTPVSLYPKSLRKMKFYPFYHFFCHKLEQREQKIDNCIQLFHNKPNNTNFKLLVTTVYIVINDRSILGWR